MAMAMTREEIMAQAGDMEEDGKICTKGNRGPLLPLFGDAEQEWPQGLRIVLYLLGLFWCFMGVSIIADVFMTAIEKVTSKKIRRFDSKKGRWYTFEVWNATVANLTLMALGSSAPEILLNVIDIFAKEFFLEGLGPSTIVGSAAFNLLMIIAVCIVAIPEGQVRKIKDMGVYCCTATWSIFAYLWLIVILMLISPDVVEVWEGVVTFLFFPVLTFMAFVLDKGWIGSGSEVNKSTMVLHEQMTPDEVAECFAEVRKQHGQSLTDDQVARIMAAGGDKATSRAKYRVNATRSLFGGKRLNMDEKPAAVTGKSVVTPFTEEPEAPAATFFLPVNKFAVLESCGTVRVKVARKGEMDVACEVFFETVEGTAKNDTDFKPKSEWVRFDKGEMEKEIEIEIVDDEAFEQDEHFSIRLVKAKADGARLVEISKDQGETMITIVDDDQPGVFSFATDEEKNQINIVQQDREFVVQIPVQRRQGSTGEVKVKYYTEDDSAIAGRDFEAAEGELVFADQQMEGKIEVTIKMVARYEKSDRFRVFLHEPQGGAKLDENRDGGEEKNILTAVIEADAESKEKMDRVTSLIRNKWNKSKVGHANWASQFKEALSVNGGGDDDDEDGEKGGSKASIQDWVAHIITLPWKLMFAFVPPTDYCGGWLCFVCALLAIGVVTMIINDMASLLGCVLCLPDDITAITFVALGTSLPDTFASMSAAKGEPYADSSVGNVTGSNSVNVFLGLGLPWMIASIAWAVGGQNLKWQAKYQFQQPELTSSLGAMGAREQVFVVPAGSLGFSVGVFSSCAVVCVCLLAVRRKFFGGELGGNRKAALASSGFLVLLWMVYIAASSIKSLEVSGSGCPDF